MKWLMLFVIIFLIIGAFIIADNLSTNFQDPDDRSGFISQFGKWLLRLGKSSSNVVGAAIEKGFDQEWLPEVNETEEP